MPASSTSAIPTTSRPSSVWKRRSALILAGSIAALLTSPSVQATNVTHTLTMSGVSDWSTATWTGGAPDTTSAGDVAVYSVVAAATTTLNTNVTIGALRLTPGSATPWTIAAGAGAFTLDGTGITAALQGFGNAGTAAIIGTGSGVFTINPNLTLATNTDIGTVFTSNIVVGGTVTASSSVLIALRAVSTGTISLNAGIGASGGNIAIVNVGTSSGLATVNGNLGSSVTSVTQDSTTSGLTLTGLNTYTGNSTVNAGTLTAQDGPTATPAANNFIKALSTGTVVLNGGTLNLRANGGASNGTIITGDGITGNNVIVGGNAAISMDRLTGTNTGNTYQFNNLTIGASTLSTSSTNTQHLRFNGTTTLTGNAAFTTSNGNDIITLAGVVSDGGSGFGITKNNSATLRLQSASTYGGATTVTGGIFLLNEAGSVNSTAGLTVTGTGAFGNPGGSAVFQVDQTATVAAAAVERVNNSANINLSLGGEFRLTQGNATTNATETVNNITFGTGASLLTINSAASRVTTIAANALTRSNLGTGVVRGSSLGNTATNAGRITLTTAPTGADFVGASTANTVSGGSTIKTLKIVPWLTGDTSTGSGNFGGHFVTYDTGSGLRPLVAAEESTLADAYVAVGENVVASSLFALTAGSRQFNSLFFTGAATITAASASDTLTIDSGAIAGFTASTITGFGSLILGNGEGVFNNGANITVASPVNVTGSGGLTKGNGGALILTASNLYTGQTTVNQGTIQFGNGGATGDLGANTANIVLNGTSGLVVNRSGTLTLANNLSGTGTLALSTTAGTTVLPGSNTYSGTTTVSVGTLQAVANAGNTTGAVATALSANSATTLATGSTLQLRGDADRTFTAASVAANAGTVTIDVNNATAGTNHTLRLNGAFNAVGNASNATPSVLNVTGGNGYTLALAAVSLGVNNYHSFNITTANLTVDSVTQATNDSRLQLAGTGNFTNLGGTTRTTPRTITYFNQGTGVYSFNGSANVPGGTGQVLINANSGTTVLNHNTATNGLSLGAGVLIGSAGNGTTRAASATAANVLLGGTNASATQTGNNGGLTFATAFAADDLNSALLTVGGQNTGNSNVFSGNITLGVTANTGKDLNLVAATGGRVDLTGNVLRNGTAPTGGVTINGAYTVSGATVNPAGTVRLSGANTYIGGTTVTAGTLIGTTATALGANGGLNVAGGANFAYRPSAAGTAALGTGVLTLAGSNTIGTAVGGTASQSALTSTVAAAVTGAVTVDVAGIPGVAVTTGTNNLITAASGLNGATFTLGKIYNATNFTVGTFAQTDTAVSLDVTGATALTSEFWKGGLAGGSNVWALSNGTTASNWAGDVGGTDTPLTPGTTATVNFTATGGTNQGAMVLGADVRVAGVVVDDATPIVLNADGNTLTIGTGGITLNGTSGGATLSALLALGGAQSWTNNSGGPLTIGGNVANGGFLLTSTGTANTTVSGNITGTGGLTKTGAATLTLSGTNSFTGTLTLSGGVIDLGSTGSLGIGANAGITGTGGTINGTGASRILINNNQTDLGVANGGTLTVTAVIANGSQSNVDFFNTAGGTGVVVLTADNLFTGTANIQSGVVSVAKIANSGLAGNLGTNGTINLGSGTGTGTLRYTGAGETNNRTLNLAGTTAGGFLEQAGAAGLLKFTADLTASGAGAKTLTLQGSTAGTGEIAGRIVDSGGGGATSLAKLGTGAWTLSAGNGYSGTTTVTAGTLGITHASALGAFAAGTTVADSATLALSGTIAVGAEAVGITGAGVGGGGAIRSTAGTNSLAGVVTLTGSSTVGVDTASTLALIGGISGPGNTLTKTGNGTLNLSNTQNYGTLTTSQGTTNVNSSFTGGTSTVNANAATNFGASQTLAALNIGAGAVVTLVATPPFAPFGLGAASDFGGSSPAGSAIVPEPGSLALLALGALGVLGRRRRAR